LKLYSALGPFLKLGGNVFGDENYLGGAADEFGFLGFGLGDDERKDGAPIGWGDGHPAVTGLEAGVECQPETKLIEIEPQAAILVADVDVDAVEAEVEVGSGQ